MMVKIQLLLSERQMWHLGHDKFPLNIQVSPGEGDIVGSTPPIPLQGKSLGTINYMDYTTCKRIPNLLRKYRKVRGLNQKQVAKILGLKSSSRICMWESGKKLPNVLNLLKLSVLYRTLIDGFFIDHVRILREGIFEKEKELLGRNKLIK